MKAGSGVYYPKIAQIIAEETEAKFSKKDEVTVKELDKYIIKLLNEYGQSLTAVAYEKYKMTKFYQQQKGLLDDVIDGIINGTDQAVITENSNKDSELASTQRDLIAGEESRDYAARKLIPTYLLNAHRAGLIHFHDMDYLIQPLHNCQLIDLQGMFKHGTCINKKWIDTPKSFQTACTLATQISLQVANGQYGGQTFTVSHLAPYVRVSYNKYLNKLKEQFPNAALDEIVKAANELLHDEVKAGVQTIQFQENTFSSSNGQTPFVSIFMYLDEDPEYKKETAMIIEEILKLRLLGMKNADGIYVTPAFPKLLFVLDEDNVPEDSEYHYLFKLAAKCSAVRANPDYISAKIMKEQFDGCVFGCMGCRSFLSPWKDPYTGKYKFYGRFNRGVVSLNLPDIALSAKGDEDKFWCILDERLELCKDALLIKDKLVRRAHGYNSPIHWQYGSIGRINPEDSIAQFCDNGYSSISLGYVGIYEATLAMMGVSHTNPKGKEFALRLIKHLEDKTIEWREIPGLHGCSLYGTPGESLTGKFERCTRERFGVVPGITDKEYFTNSYHVNVKEEIDAFTKLSFEAEFQKHSKGGAVSYVEIPNVDDNLDVIEEIMRHMYNTIQYAEFNTRSGDVCACCGFTGEIKLNENLEWECPKCHNKDFSKMSVTRRICGYLGSSDMAKSRKADMRDRVLHI